MLQLDPNTLIMAAITMAACYITYERGYKQGCKDGIDKTVDWFENNGYIQFERDSD